MGLSVGDMGDEEVSARKEMPSSQSWPDGLRGACLDPLTDILRPKSPEGHTCVLSPPRVTPASVQTKAHVSAAHPGIEKDDGSHLSPRRLVLLSRHPHQPHALLRTLWKNEQPCVYQNLAMSFPI